MGGCVSEYSAQRFSGFLMTIAGEGPAVECNRGEVMASDMLQVSIGGVETAYYRSGSGRPLLYLHGFTTLPGFDFVTAWTDTHDVIVPMHPGFGTSGETPPDDDVEDLLLHYSRFIRTLGLSDIDLVGHSLGGQVAARLAAEHPEFVRRVVLASPSGLRGAAAPLLDIVATPPGRLFDMIWANGDPSRRYISFDTDEQARCYREATSIARLTWERPFDRRLLRLLPHINQPALILWGEEDHILDPRLALDWTRLMNSPTYRAVPGHGHYLFNESEKPGALVKAFLAGDLSD